MSTDVVLSTEKLRSQNADKLSDFVEVAQDLEQIEAIRENGVVLGMILNQLKIMNAHLSILTNEEIETYARSVKSMEGYGEEDYEAIKERLKDFKNKYCS